MNSSHKLFAAVMSVGIFSIPSALRATTVTLFNDNFSNDTDVFSYPDNSAAHLPGPTSSGQGSWLIVDNPNTPIQAGVITNTLPGGGTGGANGNTHYMAISRSGGFSETDAEFSQAASTTGTLSVQWDMYDVGPGRNFIFELEDTPTDTGNVGPYIETSNFNPPSSGDMEIATRTGPGGTYNDLGGAPNNAWVHMDLEVDLAAQDYQFIVDGVSKGTFGYINPGTVGPFVALNIEGQSNAGETIYVDNVVVTNTLPGPNNLTWNNASANKLWDTASSSNWNNSGPTTVFNAQDNVTFNDNNGGAGNYAVTLNSTVSPGSVTVNNSLGDYTISGTGSIGGTGSLTKSGNSKLILSTANTYSGGTTVNAGLLEIMRTNATTSALPKGAVTITGGTLQLATNVTAGSQASPTPASNVNITSLAITGNGTLDINNNHIIIDYTAGNDPIASIAALIKSGYAAGAWTGKGITSTTAQSNAGSYGIGYADAADPGNPAGLASGQIEVMYTLLGDANLDGAVNGSDFAILATNFNKAVSGWDAGDFNYDGAANGSDFASLASNFNKGASQAADLAAVNSFASGNGLLTNVPEPASVGLLAISAIGLLGSRKRRQIKTGCSAQPQVPEFGTMKGGNHC
jgi:autotransporter-associated beta strand protein